MFITITIIQDNFLAHLITLTICGNKDELIITNITKNGLAYRDKGNYRIKYTCHLFVGASNPNILYWCCPWSEGTRCTLSISTIHIINNNRSANAPTVPIT